MLKKRFAILTTAPEYSLKTQARLVAALVAIHNFIWVYDPEDLPEIDDDQIVTGHGTEVDLGRLQSGISTEEQNHASDFRKKIALAMWQDYTEWKARHGNRQLR